jgi:hypothetical protein
VCASSVIKERQMNINIFTSRLCSRNDMKYKKKFEEEIRQLLFLLEFKQTGIDIDIDDCCIRKEMSFVLQIIIRL